MGQEQILQSTAGFLTCLLIAFGLVFLYQFAVLPRVTDFPVLVIVLGCALLPLGLLMAMSMAGMLIASLTLSFLGLQNAYHADFAQSLQTLTGCLVGLLIAVISLRVCAYDHARFATRRLAAAVHRDVIDIARVSRLPGRDRFRFLALYRLSLYFPAAEQTAAGGPIPHLGLLNDLVVGHNLLTLRRREPSASTGARDVIKSLRDTTETAFQKKLGGGRMPASCSPSWRGRWRIRRSAPIRRATRCWTHWLVLPTSGNYVLTVHTTGRAGGYGFELEQTSQINLPLNTPYAIPLAGNGQSQLYDVTIGANNPLELKLTDTNAMDQNEVYVSYGKLPTRNSYDDKFTGGPAADQTVVLMAQPGTYYVLVYNSVVKAAGSYSIEADSDPFLLNGVTPGDGRQRLQLDAPVHRGLPPGDRQRRVHPQYRSYRPVDQPGWDGRPGGFADPQAAALWHDAGVQAGGVNPDGTMTVSAVLPGGLVSCLAPTPSGSPTRTAIPRLSRTPSWWSRAVSGHPEDQRDRPEPDRLPRRLNDLCAVHQHRQRPPSGTVAGTGRDAGRQGGSFVDPGRVQGRLRLLDFGHSRWLQPVCPDPGKRGGPRHPPAR